MGLIVGPQLHTNAKPADESSRIFGLTYGYVTGAAGSGKTTLITTM